MCPGGHHTRLSTGESHGTHLLTTRTGVPHTHTHTQRCDECRELGATVGCCTSTCSANYHFQCARKRQVSATPPSTAVPHPQHCNNGPYLACRCVFLSNKEVYCHKHKDSVNGSEQVPEAELTHVNSCVFVDVHPDRPGRKMPRQLEAAKVALQLGELVGGGAV